MRSTSRPRRSCRNDRFRIARTWRRGIPDRHQMAHGAANRSAAEIHRLQCGRRRQRHLLRPHADGRRSVRADRRHGDCGRRDRCRQGLRLYPFRISARLRAVQPRDFEIARENKLLGRGILGSKRNFDLEARLGAGAYICGEETSLLESLEGKRGQIRFKPPLPAIEGLFGKPTVVNNVISLATVPVDPGQGRRLLPRFRHGPFARHDAASARRATSGMADWSSAPSA